MSLQVEPTIGKTEKLSKVVGGPAPGGATSGPFEGTKQYLSPASKTILIHGDQKTGKTTCINTVDPEWRIHIVDFDGGLESIGGYTNGDRFRVSPVNSFGELHAAMWNLPPTHDLYVLDTYTTAMKRFRWHIQATMGIDPKSIVDWRKIGGAISAMATEYLDRWRDQVAAQGAWGLIVCQDKAKDIEGGVKLCPDLVGACGRDAAGMVNFLLHLETRKRSVGGKFTLERVFRTAESPTVMAGDRSGCLNEYEPADLGALITKVTRYRESRITKAFTDLSHGKGP